VQGADLGFFALARAVQSADQLQAFSRVFYLALEYLVFKKAFLHLAAQSF